CRGGMLFHLGCMGASRSRCVGLSVSHGCGAVEEAVAGTCWAVAGSTLMPKPRAKPSRAQASGRDGFTAGSMPPGGLVGAGQPPVEVQVLVQHGIGLRCIRWQLVVEVTALRGAGGPGWHRWLHGLPQRHRGKDDSSARAA